MAEDDSGSEDLSILTAKLKLIGSKPAVNALDTTGEWNEGYKLLPLIAQGIDSVSTIDLPTILDLESKEVKCSSPLGEVMLTSELTEDYPHVLELAVPDLIVLNNLDGTTEYRTLSEDAMDALIARVTVAYHKADVTKVQTVLEDPKEDKRRRACDSLIRSLNDSSFSKDTASGLKVSEGSHKETLQDSWVRAAHILSISTQPIRNLPRDMTRWEKLLSAKDPQSDSTISFMRDVFCAEGPRYRRQKLVTSIDGDAPHLIYDEDNNDHVPEIRRTVLEQLQGSKQADKLTNLSLHGNEWSCDFGPDREPIVTVKMSGQYRVCDSEISGEGKLKQLDDEDWGTLAQCIALAFHNEPGSSLEKLNDPEEFAKWTKHMENKSLCALSVLSQSNNLGLDWGTHTATRSGADGPGVLKMVMERSTAKNQRESIGSETEDEGSESEDV